MIEATSCGGVVIFRGKILVLYKNYKNKYEGWVLPKGTVEAGEEYKETAPVSYTHLDVYKRQARGTSWACSCATLPRWAAASTRGLDFPMF